MGSARRRRSSTPRTSSRELPITGKRAWAVSWTSRISSAKLTSRGRVTIPDRGTITSRTRVSRSEKTPSKMLRSSGIRPVTLPVSIKVSSSPADKAGTSSSQLRGKPSRCSSTPLQRSIRESKGARLRLTAASNGASRRAELSGRCNTQALGSKPPSTVASKTSTRNKPASSQTWGMAPAPLLAAIAMPSCSAKPRPAQPNATKASAVPSWVATSTRRSRCCSLATAWAPGSPASCSCCTRLGRRRIRANSPAAKKASRASKTASART